MQILEIGEQQQKNLDLFMKIEEIYKKYGSKSVFLANICEINYTTFLDFKNGHKTLSTNRADYMLKKLDEHFKNGLK